MNTIGASEAEAHFSSLLERVAQGEEIVITRHGTPVARLAPVAGGRREQVRTTIARLREFSKGQTLGGLSIRKLREQGRR